MNRLRSSSPRLFSVDAANKTLPLVSAIAADLIPLWQNVTSTRKRLSHLTRSRDVEQGNPYSDELRAMQQRQEQQMIDVQGLIEELRQVGVEFKASDDESHVCFPAMLEGRLVYFSWQPGDLDVSHWMEIDAEFADRRPLAPQAASAP